MPRLWTRTIETHRREVGEAILDTTAALVGEQGLRSVTMSQIAEQAGIGRATLYKYFPDVESILVAWHQRHAEGRLAQLAELRDQTGDPGHALEAVLYALGTHLHHNRGQGGGGTDLAALVHQHDHVRDIEGKLRRFVRDVVAEAAKVGAARSDIAPEELASYALHALSGAANAPSKQALRRLVGLTLDGLRPPRARGAG